MVLTQKQFEEAKARGEYGAGITYRRYLSLSELQNRHSRNRVRRERDEAYNRATSLYEAKFKN